MKILPSELIKQNLPALVDLIGQLVTIESPSTTKPAIDRLGAFLCQELTHLAGDIQVIPQAEAGDHILCRWEKGPGGILILCHMDTVFELGTLAARPFQKLHDQLTGPGILDMKASIAMLLYALRLFRQSNLTPARPLTVLLTSDEEIGSLASRALIEAEARQAAVVFCLEPGLPDGALKTARKGTGEIYLQVQGRAAHAGVDHEKGLNAIAELAHHILAAQQLIDYTRGTTVNVGVVQGGTRPNVVPASASAEIDFRVTTPDELARLKRWVQGLQPMIPGTILSAHLELNRPPMPRDAVMVQAFQKASAIARTLGLELTEGNTGGGSDANFVAPLGIPVLDGLGPFGGGAHSEHEYVRLDSLESRTALLSALLLNW